MQAQLAQHKLFEDFDKKWAKSKPFIEKAVLRQDLYTIDDIECKIRSGFFMLWSGENSAMVTECIEYPRARIMNLLFCGGKYEELESMMKDIEIFAKRCGIKRLYGGGRLGWLRKIPKELGFKAENVISKDL